MEEQAIAQNIRRLRKQAQLTIQEAADAADLTKSALSKIERGQISPPISTMLRIAAALNISINDFFTAGVQEPVYVLTRKNQGDTISRDGSQFGYVYEALGLQKRNKAAEPFIITINPGDPTGEFHHDGEEFIHMLSGQLEMIIDNEPLKLNTGDSLYFDSSHVHKTLVYGNLPARFICLFIQKERT
ncbi:MAG: helix-turn-helix transcriptional regulator [Spirochaetaceae bacterium]|nr:helix-turn-helix transcriptional regulator [Spirochaetaceae bacterium]